MAGPLNFSYCHQHARPIGSSTSAVISFSTGAPGSGWVGGTVTVALMYCDSDRSNFARVSWSPYDGASSLPGNIWVFRENGRDGGADNREAFHDIAPSGSQDSPVIYSPNNLAHACVQLAAQHVSRAWVCTPDY